MPGRVSRADWIAPSWGLSVTWTGTHLVFLPGWSGLAFSVRCRETALTRLSDAVERSRRARDRG